MLTQTAKELQHTLTLLAKANNDLALANSELYKVKHDLADANTWVTRGQRKFSQMKAAYKEQKTLVAQYQGQATAALNESNILKHKLLLAEKDIATLHDQVKLNDDISPGEVVSSFKSILANVADISDDIAGAVGAGSVMAQDVLNWNNSADHLPVSLRSLWQSKAVGSRALDELLQNRSVYTI
jgi:chromosome segregation ATPase